MKTLRLLHLRRFRRRPLRTLVLLLCVAGATSLSTTVLTTTASLDRSLAAFGTSLSGPTPLRVVGSHNHGSLADSAAAMVETAPGVGRVAPVVQTVAVVVGSDEDRQPVVVVGADCGAAAVVGFPCPSTADGADLDRPLVAPALAEAVGSTGSLRTNVGAIPLAGAAVVPELDSVNQGRLVVLPLAEAQRGFSRPGAFDVIYVEPDGTVPLAQLERGLADEVGETGEVLRSDDLPPGADDFGVIVPLLFLIALITAGLGGTLVYNTVSVDLEERRRELAVESVVGVPPRLIAGALIIEAGLVGALGGFAGGLIGTAAARPVVASLSDRTERVVGAVLTPAASLSAIVAAVTLGALVAMLATVPVARRAGRLAVADELRGGVGAPSPPTALPSWRHLALATIAVVPPLLLGAITRDDGGISPWSPVGAYLSIVGATCALLVACGTWAPVIAAGVRRARSFAPFLGLAAVGLATNPRRARALVGVVALAVGLGAGLASFLPANRAGVDSTFGRLADGRVHVTTVSLTGGARMDSRLTPDVLEAIDGLAATASVDRTYAVFLHENDGELGINAYERLPEAFPLHAGDDSAGEVLARGEVLVGPALARQRGARVGDVLRITTPEGSRPVVVGGIWRHPDDSGRSVTMSPELLEQTFGAQPATSAFVRPAPGTSEDALVEELRQSDLDPLLEARSSSEYAADLASEVAAYIAPFMVLQRVLLAVTVLSTISTMLLIAMQRRREQGVLAAVGLTPSGLGRLAVLEAAFIGVVGSVLGLLTGLGLTVALTNVAGVLFGVQPPLSLDVWGGLAYALLTVLCVVLAASVPARALAAAPIVELLRYE